MKLVDKYIEWIDIVRQKITPVKCEIESQAANKSDI